MEPSNRVAFAEPFRIFFPLGLILGAIGVSLWPLFYWHVISVYPAAPHMRLMIEGLMGSFVIGFLGTAGPRLLEAKPMTAVEVIVLLGLQISSALLHLSQQQVAGDILFLTLLLFFLGALLRRASTRMDLPPPSFVLVFFGFLNAIAGIILILSAQRTNSFFANQLGTLMLNEGFILFPILGVGAFFLPKLLGGGIPEPADLRIASALWRRRAAIAALSGLAIWSSFAIEAVGWTRSAAILRGLTTLFYLVAQGHLVKKGVERPFLARCFQFGGFLLAVGLLLPAVLPAYRVANLHVVFIGGFSIILFTVSTRVILGHSGHSHLFQRRLGFLVTVLILLVLAMLSRVSADLFPGERDSHLVYAALIWLVAAGVWAGVLVPKLWLSEE
ncbi:MAG: NnrS family protein [Chthoniobacterales bacterium]